MDFEGLNNINESDLNKFTKVDLNEFNIKKYKSSCKGLSHIRTGPDYKGKIYLENNKVVGFYNIRISDNYLQGIEINEEYRSKGLGKELLKESIREGVKKLSVNKKNKKAINMYKKDFTIIDQDNTMYYMELKSSNNTIDESITNENYFMSKDDKYLKFDKLKNQLESYYIDRLNDLPFFTSEDLESYTNYYAECDENKEWIDMYKLINIGAFSEDFYEINKNRIETLN